MCPWVCDGVYVASWPERREQRVPRAESSQPGWSLLAAQTGVTPGPEKMCDWTLVRRGVGQPSRQLDRGKQVCFILEYGENTMNHFFRAGPAVLGPWLPALDIGQ